MNAVSFLRKQHKKDLPATRLQEDVNRLLEDLRDFIIEEEKHESEELARLNEINVDFVLSEKVFCSDGKYRTAKKMGSHMTVTNPHVKYQELENGGRIFSGARGIEERPLYFKIYFGKIHNILGSFVRQLKF
ncbi:MAG: hypothetical protein U1D31_03120 [Patescibacteria group bacterium]|nr:hypothetical protein [bacterium]MDZ4241085.1 hypothetical protein [Patescibacteria group bacterium]